MKIDFVIPWVDGNDPEWLKEKSKYSGTPYDDLRDIRFRDWDLLKFFFRGVEKFAPWVNKIHFITAGHIPSWLNTENPKLNIVKHNDYIPDEYLPTFSSHPIEINMFRIKELSEHFVYFNDDIFLLKEVSKEDFFTNGLPNDILVESAITPRIGEFSTILCQNTGIINKNFEKSDIKKLGLNKYFNLNYKKLLIRTITTMPYTHIMGFYNHHICQSFRKSTFEELWEKEYETLDLTSKNKFRNQSDVSAYLFRYWALTKGEFYPKYPIGKYFNIKDDYEKIIDSIKNQKYKVITINDNDGVKDFTMTQKKIYEAFNIILQEKSTFEI